ncbi:MAG: hypothetical protein ACLU37_01890 [Collinsella sp.]
MPAYRRAEVQPYAGETDEEPANIPLDEETGAPTPRRRPKREVGLRITEFRLPDAPKVYLSPIVDLFDSSPGPVDRPTLTTCSPTRRC